MAEATRKVSAASARSHTRKSNTTSSSSSGMLRTITVVLFVGLLAWAYQVTHPPPSNLCGSPGGPPITAPRIKLRDGRHLAYKELGLPRESAKHKIVYIHPFASCRHDEVIVTYLSPELVQELGVYVVSFDRPGYGESDPNPKRNVKSLALDVEELADQLELGSKFYVIGFSMGGQAVWGCLKYIPHRLAGAALLTPVVNYWWPGFPANLSEAVYNQLPLQDQWCLRIVHYAPWLAYWWNTQKLFPASSAVSGSPRIFSPRDIELLPKLAARKAHEGHAMQQGVLESMNRDLIIGFGSWEFDPMDLKNPLPNNEGSVHVWQGDDDRLVPATLQRHIAGRLPWVHYHELPGAGHLFPCAEGASEAILKALLPGEK
ncbi:uncharacterized protein LOC131166093 [Malania oleifera]|uniref:uncharacterized protein LOC131166093 n=1 Tax=Malania oleifera TaxID=397392 RepID=UPI0025AEC8EA|nr:uncharacterized protein LOC131166093 [Malania oleifera]XP_057980350.1 uncharacterized protein LOC131166093 [Malania oleifera]XP_057980351.1 uncharacterized protein LOC131166093 [Malania oleifera]